MKYYRKINGIIPGMKNNKMLVKVHGRTIPITKPETQKRMTEIIQELFCGGEFQNPVNVEINIHLKSPLFHYVSFKSGTSGAKRIAEKSRNI